MDTTGFSDFFRQFSANGQQKTEPLPSNGHTPTPPPPARRSETPAPPSSIAPFYETHSPRVEQAQGGAVEKAEMGMVSAQAKKIAHDKTQADIDIVHAVQSFRIVSEVTRVAWDYMGRMEDDAAQCVAKYPQLEARIQLMTNRAQNGMTEAPGMITDAYLRRYYGNGPDPRAEEKWIH